MMFEKAKNAINDLFNDTSVPQETTRGRLEALAEEIEMLLDALG